jgi:hypothetical protein
VPTDPRPGQQPPFDDVSESAERGHLLTRRYFLRGAGTTIIGASAVVALAGHAAAATPGAAAAGGRVFANAEGVYATLGALIVALSQSAGLGSAVRGLNTTILFELSEPDALIYASLFEDEARVEFGSSPAKPKTTLSMSADTAHDLFAGIGNWPAAVADKQLRLRGAVEDLALLVPRFHYATPIVYRGILIDAGRADLVTE